MTPEIDALLGRLLDGGDLFEREPLVDGGAHDGVGLVGIELTVGPPDRGEGDEHVGAESGFVQCTLVALHGLAKLHAGRRTPSSPSHPRRLP